MRLQKIVHTNDGLEISYLDEADIDTNTGIIKISVLEIPHHQLDDVLFTDFLESVEAILDDVRIRLRRPVETFQAAR